MITIDISVPREDVEAMNSAFSRYVQYVNGDVSKAVDKTSYFIARSLRASTKEAKIKKRPVIKNTNYIKDDWDRMHRADARRANISQWYDKHAPEKNRVYIDGELMFSAKWAVHRIKAGKSKLWYVASKSRSDAVQSPVRNVKKRGLADASWYWMLAKMNAPAKGKSPASVDAKGVVTNVSRVSNGTTTTMTLENKLPYIRKAFLTSGDRAIDSVMSRARKALEFEMMTAEEKAAKKAGVK